MRLKISLASKNTNYKIPFNYNHILSAIIYRKIEDLDLASKLHSSMGFKHFTFSQLSIHHRMITKEGIISKDGKFEFYISSPNDYLIQSMVDGFIEDQNVIFKGNNLIVEQVELLKKPSFKHKMQMKTMSPIIVRIKREIKGKLKIWDMNPGELQFYTGLQKNLINKYTSFYNNYDGDEYVQIVPELKSVKRKRITINKNGTETHNRAYQMRFNINADPKLIEFAYDCGLGEKNSMGFGMIERLGSGIMVIK
jgi:CRISPR-associated endoribonuclease Cas6